MINELVILSKQGESSHGSLKKYARGKGITYKQAKYKREYELGGNNQEFNVKYENSEIIIESDDFKVAMDFHSFEEIREKLNNIYEELM